MATNSLKEEKIKSDGGLNIFVRSWRPAEEPRGVVVIVPGFNSHSGYYLWTADQLTQSGFAVYAVDLRGRGLSDGERFYMDSISEYISDVHNVVKLAKSREPGLPVFLLGHSAGGVISCVYTLEHQEELSGLICESFAFKVPAPDVVLAVFKGISHLAPHGHIFKLNNVDFSRDPQIVQAMNDDPLIDNETQPNQTLAEMVRADERIEREFPLITLPLFILHDSLDKATKPSGSQFFYDTAGSTDKTIKIYEGYFHDLLNDVGREAVIADITSWIEARLPVLKSEAAVV